MTWSSAKKIRASKGIEILRQTYAHASTVWAIISLAALCSACSPEPAFYDILIKNGTVIDGSGDPRQLSDVGIRAGHIAFVGTANQADDATIVIDASGLIVAPGFIDVHNHTLDVVLDDRWSDPHLNSQYLTQGVTTMVTGADGYWSPRQIRIIKQRLSNLGSGVNYACYVGHNGIRSEVMKDDQRREPTQVELQEMVRQTGEGMEEGCVGLSTGLMYHPGSFSTTEEVIALAKEVSKYGGTYDSHVRDPAKNLIDSDREVIRIAANAGIPAKIAHLKAVGRENEGALAEVIGLVQAARAGGLDIVSDQYPYDGAGGLTNLGELVLFPGIQKLYQTGDTALIMQAVKDALADTSQRGDLKHWSENGVDGSFSWLGSLGYGAYRIQYADDYPEIVGRNFERLAEEHGIDPFDLLAKLLLDSDQPIWLTGSINEYDHQTLMQQPWNMIASDGFYVPAEGADVGIHPRGTGTFPRFLGHYIRDLGLLSLEQAIHKITAFPADHLGFPDRGKIDVGMVADITVFDQDTIIDRSTWLEPTLFSEGVHFVIVNGQMAVEDSEVTNITAGTFVFRDNCNTRPDECSPSRP